MKDKMEIMFDTFRIIVGNVPAFLIAVTVSLITKNPLLGILAGISIPMAINRYSQN